LDLLFCWDIACRADWAIRGIVTSFLTSLSWAPGTPLAYAARESPVYDCIEPELILFNLVHIGNVIP